jgi:hypothetical protein
MPGENDDPNRRMNLIERQRDPQRERSGHRRAPAETTDPRRSSLLPVGGLVGSESGCLAVIDFPPPGERHVCRGLAGCVSGLL